MKKLKIRKISYGDITELSKIISEIYLELPYALTFDKKPGKIFLHELISQIKMRLKLHIIFSSVMELTMKYS